MMNLKTNRITAPLYDGAERRKYQRVEKPVIIRFRIKPRKKQESYSTDWDMVYANDLSARGLFFNSSYNIEIGAILEFRIGFSISSPPLSCTGIVTRVKNHPHTSIFGIATQFLQIEEEEKEFIDRYVHEKLQAYLTGIN